MHPSRIVAVTALAFVFAFGVLAQQTSTSLPSLVSSSAGTLKTERLATLEYPWGMALLPDGRLVITEKPGRMRIWEKGKLSAPLQGVPKVVHRSPKDQGGLLDVEVGPDFDKTRFLYFSYVEAAEANGTYDGETDDFRLNPDLTDNIVRGGVVARARLEGNELKDVKVIWRQQPKTVGRGHFGNRIAFARDGSIFITSGDRMRFEPAQRLESNLGKVIRIQPDGSIPKDNPFVDQEKARGEIWSYGHRNILSLAIDPSTDRVWAVEMGPLGGDELNLIERGRNYGWPLVSDGDHYTRPTIPKAVTMIPGHGTSKEFQKPVRSWTPVISPSGATFYTGTLFPSWRGSMLVGGLSSQALVRLAFDGDLVSVEERINMRRRIRDVLQAPDGAILLLVDDANGDLLRLTPADGQK